MKIVFANAHPYPPQIAGGSQSNTHEMAMELLTRGHKVAVLAGLTGHGWIGGRNRTLMKLSGLAVLAGLTGHGWIGGRNRTLMKLSGRKAVRDSGQGYSVYRSWFAWEGAAEVARLEQPDIAVVQSGSILRVANAFRAAGVPVSLYLHNVEFDDHGGTMEDFRDSVFLANSKFTAGRYQRTYGIGSKVINPFFQAERYKVHSTRERVLFINPHPVKGVTLALELAAACPDIPFDFVESWTLSDDRRATLRKDITALGNVTLHPRTNDMREHYGRARIVLAPSRWEETWGRIASEAHYSGIPVLATAIGGLTEAVGPGGITLSPGASIADWTGALRMMWDDVKHYDSLCEAALRYSRRPQLDRALQIDSFEKELKKAIRQQRTVPAPA